MAKRSHNKSLSSVVAKLTQKYRPDDILHEISVIYEEFSIASKSEAEVEFWLKCSRATANLSSGTDKWFAEMLEEKQEEDEE